MDRQEFRGFIARALLIQKLPLYVPRDLRVMIFDYLVHNDLTYACEVAVSPRLTTTQ